MEEDNYILKIAPGGALLFKKHLCDHSSEYNFEVFTLQAQFSRKVRFLFIKNKCFLTSNLYVEYKLSFHFFIF